MAISSSPEQRIMDFQPMGDQALLAYCDDEQAALSLSARVRQRQFPWVLDVVQAYKSVAIFVDLDQIDFSEAAAILNDMCHAPHQPEAQAQEEGLGRLHVIPCCYALGLDFEQVAKATGLDAAEIIRLHASQVYTIHAIGFCPGFPYLGYLPPALCGVPRLPSPRRRVAAGSVGLTGRQTGIYTMERPGGWNIVGRTPLRLVDVADGYFPLRTGDRIQFRPIDAEEFQKLLGQQMARVETSWRPLSCPSPGWSSS